LAVVVLAGCSQKIPLPTHLDGNGGIGFGGRLGGEPPCLWLEYDTGQRTIVIWPAGFTARADPVRIVAPDGQVIATVGDLIEGGGAPGRGGPVPGCPIAASVLLTEISSVNGQPVRFPSPRPPPSTLPPHLEPR
jgi:hypothetical protein